MDGFSFLLDIFRAILQCMQFIHAIILGVVEGITEFLPVSSTAHLILAGALLKIPGTEFFKTFIIAIQLGAILAVLIAYGHRFFENRTLIPKVLVAFLPTAIIGFALYHFLKNVLLTSPLISIVTLFIGGIVLMLFDHVKEETKEERDVHTISYAQAFTIGAAQALAIVPGVSRSAATIVTGLLMGIGRSAIVEFSFLLAVPTIGAASLYDLFKTAPSFSNGEFALLAFGFVTSCISALFTVRIFSTYVKTHSFRAFGGYRIVIALISLTMLTYLL